MSIEVSKADIASIERMLNGIKDGAKKAMVTSINLTVKTTSVQTRKDIGKSLNLTAKRIGEDIETRKASYSNIKGRVFSWGDPIGLINFTGTKQFKKGTKVKVLRTGNRKLIPQAFVAKSRNAKNVWMRSLKGGKRVHRLPIDRLTGPSVRSMMAYPSRLERLTKNASEIFEKNLLKKVEDLLRRYG